MADKKEGLFGTVIVGVVIFGGIGYWIGDFIGFLIGSAIAIGAIMSGSSDDKVEPDNKKISSDDASSSTEDVSKNKPDGFSFGHTPSRGYQSALVDLAALIIVADGKIEESEIDTAAELIEYDDFITDKSSCSEGLRNKIEELQCEYEKSPVAFKLKAVSVMQVASSFKKLIEQDRVLVFLETLLDSIEEGDKCKAEAIYSKIKRKIQAVDNISNADAAEMYILKSGNQEAIQEFARMKADPRNYKKNFREASKSNSVMRTAFGVFAGMIAANLVMGAINQMQLDEALASFDSSLEDMGGLDNVELNESIPNDDMGGDIVSGDEFGAEEMPLDGDADVSGLDETVAMDDVGGLEDVDVGGIEDADADVDADGFFDDLDIFG